MARVHRFHDKVAAYLGTGQTVYMAAEEARAFGQALLICAQSVEEETFIKSTCGTFDIDISEEDE